MKKLIYIICFLIATIGYAQQEELPNIKGSFKITAIDSLKNYYIVSATDSKNELLKILINKPKRKVFKKIIKDSTYSKIQLGDNYNLNLESMTWSIGYLPTEKIIMDDKEIWDRKTSRFYVYESKELKGLYFKSN